MPQSDLERTERELERRIAEKERAIGDDLALIRANARQASTTAMQVAAAGAALVGAFLLMRVVRYVVRPRIGVVWPARSRRLVGRRLFPAS
jgi:hypothetical protein